MSQVSLSLFKQHVRADDFAGDDAYLQHVLDTAEASVVSATGRGMAELCDAQGIMALPLQHAVMMLAAHWYNQREGVSVAQMHDVPYAVEALVKPYVKLGR